MSNEETPEQNPQRQDELLEYVVSQVTASEMELGITLQVGGFLVSGLLVSGLTYLEAFGADFSSRFPDKEAAAGVQDAFSKVVDKLYGGENPQALQSRPTYLHLKNARFFSTTGTPIPADRGVWWRGRLTEVQGFILGVLS